MSAIIHYHDIGDYLSREEKLRIVDDFGDIDAIDWQILTPDRHGDWLNKRDSEFDDYVPLAPTEKFDHLSKSWFTANSSGLKTGMDDIAIGYSQQAVVEAVKNHLGHSDKTKTVEYSYRPFNKQWLYYDRETNQRQYRMPSLFPPEENAASCPHSPASSPSRHASPSRRYPNKVICVTAPGGSKDFSCVMGDCIPDLHFCGDVQAFPLYWYEKIERKDNVMELPGLEKQSGYIRHDAISDFILLEIRKIAGPRVQKEDIFHYVYGALHDPDYRAKFAADLKKQIPRLPLPKDRKAFEKVESIGRKLANLHLHYEEIEPWALDEIGTLDYHVTKMAWAKDGKAVRKDMLVVNEHLTLAGIPAEAHRYVVNGRTPLDWLIDRYQMRTDSESGIVNDPNKWGEEHDYPPYVVELAKRLVSLSVETVELIGKLGSGEQETGNGESGNGEAAQPIKNNTPPYWWKSGVWGVPSALPQGGNVVMGLQQKWYDKIEAGLKHDDFRQIKPYWDERLGGRKGRELRSVTFMRGRASPVQMTWEVLGVETAKDPGRIGYYVIHLGKRIK